MQHADRLDRAQALTRPGRIDRKVSVPLPDENGRRAILALHARRLSIELEVSGATPRPDARVEWSFVEFSKLLITSG